MLRLKVIPGLVILAILAGLLVTASPVQAATTINVTTFSDELNTGGACSLREAIISANTDTAVGGCTSGTPTGVDTIRLSAGTYTLGLAAGADIWLNDEVDDDGLIGDLDILTPITIIGVGPDQTIITGRTGPNPTDRHATRIFEVFMINSASDTATFVDLSIKGGYAYYEGYNPSRPDPMGLGGGISNGRGNVSLMFVTLEDNWALVSGGGLASEARSNDLKIYHSTIKDNIALYETGGGVNSKSRLSINNSLFWNNSCGTNDPAKPQGLGTNGGGLFNNSTYTHNRVSNTTFAGNKTFNNSAPLLGRGSALYSDGRIELVNNTIANNSSANNARAAVELGVTRSFMMNNLLVNNLPRSCLFDQITDGTNNMGTDDSCGSYPLYVLSPSINLSPNLELNQGYTLSYAPLAGSAAIEGGVKSFLDPWSYTTIYAPGTDQRWALRPMKGISGGGPAVIDIGSIEAPVFDTQEILRISIKVPFIFR